MAIIQAGRHDVTVADHQLGRSGTGTPHIAVRFEDEHGAGITWYGYLTDGALNSTLKALDALKWDTAVHDGRIDSLNGTGVLVGTQATIVVENEEYKGEWHPKVKWVNELGGGGSAERMDAAEASSFAVDLRKKILAAKGPRPDTGPGQAHPVSPSTPPPGQTSDSMALDDIPF